MKAFIRNLLLKLDLIVTKYPDNDLRRRIKIVDHYGIDTIIDVGANDGCFAQTMRKIGYKKKIISFEPLKNVFAKLEQVSRNDKIWDTYNFALGNEDATGIINVSDNLVSSSILNILPVHIKNAPQSKYIAQETILIKKLDSVFDSLNIAQNNIMLKIDTQGFEKNVLEGAKKSLRNIIVIQLEMSICALYEKEVLFDEMISYLKSIGFQLFSLENGFSDFSTGQLLQVDGIFVKQSVIAKHKD